MHFTSLISAIHLFRYTKYYSIISKSHDYNDYEKKIIEKNLD